MRRSVRPRRCTVQTEVCSNKATGRFRLGGEVHDVCLACQAILMRWGVKLVQVFEEPAPTPTRRR